MLSGCAQGDHGFCPTQPCGASTPLGHFVRLGNQRAARFEGHDRLLQILVCGAYSKLVEFDLRPQRPPG